MMANKQIGKEMTANMPTNATDIGTTEAVNTTTTRIKAIKAANAVATETKPTKAIDEATNKTRATSHFNAHELIEPFVNRPPDQCLPVKCQGRNAMLPKELDNLMTHRDLSKPTVSTNHLSDLHFEAQIDLVRNQRVPVQPQNTCKSDLEIACALTAEEIVDEMKLEPVVHHPHASKNQLPGKSDASANQLQKESDALADKRMQQIYALLNASANQLPGKSDASANQLQKRSDALVDERLQQRHALLNQYTQQTNTPPDQLLIEGVKAELDRCQNKIQTHANNNINNHDGFGILSNIGLNFSIEANNLHLNYAYPVQQPQPNLHAQPQALPINNMFHGQYPSISNFVTEKVQQLMSATPMSLAHAMVSPHAILHQNGISPNLRPGI